MKSLLVLAFLAILSFVCATNYCDPKLCPPNTTHISCNNDGSIPEKCQSPRPADLEPHKERILNLHNKIRNQVAGGGLESLPPAARMATMQWDKELASIAARSVLKCSRKTDKCRNTETFKNAGQIVVTEEYFSDEPDKTEEWLLDELIGETIYETHLNAEESFIDNYPGSFIPPFAPFSQVITESSVRVGCSGLHYITGVFKNFQLSCIYATKPMDGRPVYVKSETPASGCKTGTNPDFSNLCSKDEVYAV